jgi:peptidoglycan/xylan/chitin deacetylase (PgdA/CDA1 family)
MAGFGLGVRASAVAAAVALTVCAPAAAQTADACPSGWSPEATVEFAPPVPAIEAGVVNRERAGGCTLLDDIWAAEPFHSHGAFVDHVSRTTDTYARDGLLSRRERDRILTAAGRSGVGGRDDHQLDNSCPNRIAFTFDDGTSFYRPRTLQALRDRQVHGNFFDNGFRVAANPQLARFQVREDHVELNHTYNHVNMSQLSDAGNREEVLSNEAFLAQIGAPLTFKGIRPPFGGSNPAVQALLASMGYTAFLSRIGTDDWIPERTAAQIRDAILAQLRPGAIVALHDGPVDTPAGAATVEALGQIIDGARSRGYCFGVVDRSGAVVADRYVSSGRPIPGIVDAVPYHRLVFGTADQIEGPFEFTISPIVIAATHSPASFTRGQPGALVLTVSNRSAGATDGETVTVTDAVPAGLSATAAGGDGWTCSGTATIRCTRRDVLAAGESYPAITISVEVAPDAPAALTNAPTVTGHGGVWSELITDRIEVGG